MSKLPPLTHAVPLHIGNEKLRPLLMAEYVANGHPNIVLNTGMMREIIKTPALIRTLKLELELTGARFVDSHAPFGPVEDLNLPFESERRTMLMRHKVFLEICAEFGVDTITIHTGNNAALFEGYSIDQLRDNAIRSLEELLPEAERLGVTISIENIWTPANVVHRILEIYRYFDSPNLGLCYDSGHANITARDRDNPESAVHKWWKDHLPVVYDDQVLEKMLPYMVTCHLHDNDGLRDHHMLPGRGTIDWDHVIGLLRKAPRLKYIQNEASWNGVAETCRIYDALLK